LSWHTRPGLSGCIAVEYRWKRKTRNINPVLARSIFSPLNLPIGRSSRIYLLLTVIFGFVRGGLIIAQAYYLSLVISGFFLGGYTLDKLRNQVPIILGIVLARAGLAYFSEVMAQQGSSTIKSGIRNHLALHLMELGPAFVQQERTGDLVTTAMQGVESLEVYFSQYLPQLFLAILVPAAILCFVFPMDVLTGLVFLLTAPLIPIFMVLIASQSEAATKRQWTQLARLSAYFLDALQGLVPVKLLGRSQDRIAGISRSSEQYRSVTMNVLRITFLSALVLELVGTISIAVVAVEIGLRLLNGGMVYREALFILILAPEFYMPLRLLGMRFHAAMPAMSAAERIKEILETRWLRSAGNAGTPALHHTCPEPQVLGTQSGASAARQGRGDKKPLAPEGLPGEAIDKLCIQSDTPYGLHWRNNRALPDIRFEDVHFSYPEGEDTVRPALHGISFTIQPGQRLAIVGPSCYALLSPHRAGSWLETCLSRMYLQKNGANASPGFLNNLSFSMTPWKRICFSVSQVHPGKKSKPQYGRHTWIVLSNPFMKDMQPPLESRE
jgi:ATP-binding cassette subfamily C protein CydD